jgi:hypothetical protein
VNVSCPTTSAGEPGGRLWESGLEKRGWTACRGTAAGLRGFEGVSCTATAGVDVFACVWVRFGDRVLGWHCSCGLFGCGKQVDVIVFESICSVMAINRRMKGGRVGQR